MSAVTRVRNLLRQEGTLIILFGILGTALAPLVGIFAWHLWQGDPIRGVAHIASMLSF